MLLNHFHKSKQMERGSIMLEVIAVLALMGVMGAMLFRQIYQRNQELHNIQMASEIRTIKEAFSAYIQAERSVLMDDCVFNDDGLPSKCAQTSEALAGACTAAGCTGIRSYLPSGWFSDNNLQGYYTLSLWGYKQNDVTKKNIMYGVIVPTSKTLPQTGWNFKRAARVALLVGADGGAYDPDITGDIAGSLGTWALTATGSEEDLGLTEDDIGPDQITYVAITGMDIFTPEYELPEGNVAFPENLDLGMREAQAWKYFAAGGSKGCYSVIGHTIAHDVGGGSIQIDPDIIQKYSAGSCEPLFWVDNDAGTVFVNNDLKIGVGGTENVTIRQEGPIVFNANDSDPQNSNDPTAYILDPQNTSVMNDVKIMSRGGARLSEILPKYILRESYYRTVTGNTLDINKPADPPCRTGYSSAFMVSLVDTGAIREGVQHTHGVGTLLASASESSKHTHSITGTLGGTTVTIDGKSEDSPHTHTTNLEATNSSTHSHEITGKTAAAGNLYVTGVPTIERVDDTDATWRVTITRNGGGNPTLAIQTYCVWSGAVGSGRDRKTQMGADWAAFAAKITTAEECRSYGGTWSGGNCT